MQFPALLLHKVYEGLSVNEITFDKIVRPFFTTVAAVSSQELSIARILISFCVSVSTFFSPFPCTPFQCTLEIFLLKALKTQNVPQYLQYLSDIILSFCYSSSNCSSTDWRSLAAIVFWKIFVASPNASSGLTMRRTVMCQPEFLYLGTFC